MLTNTATANAYKNQQIMTAPPEQLTLMLYDGAIRFISEGMRAIDQGDNEKAHNANLKAQNIIKEFMCTLDMQYELSKNYMLLYDFILRLLISGNTQKNKKLLADAKGLVTDLRDAWAEAMKQFRQSRGGHSVNG